MICNTKSITLNRIYLAVQGLSIAIVSAVDDRGYFESLYC